MEYGRNITIGNEEFQVGVLHSGSQEERLAYNAQPGDQWNEVDEHGVITKYEYVNGAWSQLQYVSSTNITSMIKLTQVEYDNLQTKDPSTFYVIVAPA